MAHQCLACGHLFTDGSSAILQGCPDCKGTRFFYTQEPLPEDERRALADRAQKDLRQVVAELLKASATGEGTDLEKKARAGQLRPADLRPLLKQVADTQARAERNAQWVNPDAKPVVVQARVQEAKARLEKEIAEASKAPEHPDTVNIRRPGQYDIDVKALLDRSPIVVHRDGAYHIHLASLFDQARS